MPVDVLGFSVVFTLSGCFDTVCCCDAHQSLQAADLAWVVRAHIYWRNKADVAAWNALWRPARLLMM